MTGAFLLSTTLPTVIGMGVVAETTRVMFDKRTGKKRVVTVRKRTTRNFKVHRGKRGGKYIMKKGRRIYI